MKNSTDEIKISLSNGALTYEITLQKFAINYNTKEWLLEEIEKHLDKILKGESIERQVIGNDK